VELVRRLNPTKVCVKSYGTALVKVRWSFSDKALYISDVSLNISEDYGGIAMPIGGLTSAVT
jgi:hypothetical protein